MDTLTTVQKVERTESGAFKITFLGDKVAGTFDEELGARAEQALAEDMPVGISLRDKEGRLYVEKLTVIQPPEELGGVTDEEQAAADAKAGFTPDPAVEEGMQKIEEDELLKAAEELGIDLSPEALREAATDQGDDAAILPITGRLTVASLGEKLNEVIDALNAGRL